MKYPVILAAVAALLFLPSCVTLKTTYPDGRVEEETKLDPTAFKTGTDAAVDIGTKAIEAREADKQAKAAVAK